jgi:hypothetical protein
VTNSSPGLYLGSGVYNQSYQTSRREGCSRGFGAQQCRTIVAVRSSLLAFVPTELADLILDEAKYWSEARWSFKPKVRMALDSKSNGGDNATFCCLLTPKLCELLYSGMDGVIKMKSVCFKIASYDELLPWYCWNNDSRRNFSGMI